MGWLLDLFVDLFWEGMVIAAYRRWGLLAAIAIFLAPFLAIAATFLFLFLLVSPY
jgi:hypothetical protein